MLELGSHRFDPATGQLTDTHGTVVHLRRKSQQVLEVLATSPGHLVTKDDIADRVWQRSVVSDESLSQCISDIRRVLGDVDRTIVKTLQGRGFLLEATPIETRAAGRLPVVTIEPLDAPQDNDHAQSIAQRLREALLSAIVRRRGIRVATPVSTDVADYRIGGRVWVDGNSITASFEIEEAGDRGIFYTESFNQRGQADADFVRNVARKVTNVQRVSAIASFGARYRTAPNQTLDLQQLLQKAAHHYSRITETDTDRAFEVLSHAVGRFPESPMARAMLAATYVHMYPLVRIDRSETRVKSALDHVDHAIYEGPDIDFVIRTRGNLRFWLLRDLEGAEEDCRRALSITPNYQLAHLTLVQMDLFSGRIPAAKQRFEDHIEVDVALPQFHYFQTIEALFALHDGDAAGARRHAKEAFEYAPWSEWGVLVNAAVIGRDVASLDPTLRSRIETCRLPADHFLDLPGDRNDFVTRLSSRARLAGIA